MFSWPRIILVFCAVVAVALFYPFAATDAQRRAVEFGYSAVLAAKVTDGAFVMRVILAAALFVGVEEIIMAPVFRNISKRGRTWKMQK